LSRQEVSPLKWLLVSVILLNMPIRPVVPFPADRPGGRGNATSQSSSQSTSQSQLPSGPQIRAALDWFAAHRAWIDDEQARLTEIPAPSFQESERAAAVKVLLSAVGLEVSTDKAGNVTGLLRGATDKEIVILSAHLDTVFPAGSDVKVHRDKTRMTAPGISDNGAGLAALVAVARALHEARIQPQRTILFVANVGEEGEGDLRGVRYLFESGAWSDRINAFVSFDGPDVERITNAAIGSRRYRATFRGLGGHSWGDFGVANPVNALGKVVSILSRYPAPAKPRTTFNVGKISGGTGTNVIPVEASMDVDLRSEAGDELQRLDAFFRRALRQVVDEENRFAR